MDWNSLKTFLAITETGSLAGAARSLGVNHSTTFRRLNHFEGELEGRLFERHGNEYEMTPLGEELLVYARSIADRFDDLERHIVGKDVRAKGVVKITAPNNIAYRYLPRYLDDFGKTYPDIQTEILVSNLEFNMSSRQADIAIRATSAPPDFLIGKLLRKISWGVYAADTYEKRHGLPVNIEELQFHRLIGSSGGMESLPAYRWLNKNLKQQIVHRSDDLVAMSYLAQAGQGLAVLPDDQLRPGLTRLFVFEPGESSDLWLLTHPDLRNVERVRLVMQHLTEAFSHDVAFLGAKDSLQHKEENNRQEGTRRQGDHP